MYRQKHETATRPNVLFIVTRSGTRARLVQGMRVFVMFARVVTNLDPY